MSLLQNVAVWLIFGVGALVILGWTAGFIRRQFYAPPPSPPAPEHLPPAELPKTCPCPRKAPLTGPVRSEIHGNQTHLCYQCTQCGSDVKLPA